MLRRKTTYAVALVIALALTGVASANQAAGVLVTTGSAEITAVPDEATVVIGVSVLSQTAASAQSEVAMRMEEMRRAIQRLGVPDKSIQTRDFRVGAEYDYREGQQVLRGYRATHDLYIKIDDIARLGAVLDAVVNAGASNVREIQFGTSRAPELLRQALTAAVRDAREKAEALAEGAGVTTLRVNRIQDQTGYSAPARNELRTASKAAFDMGAQTEIAPGEITLRANVQVEFLFW
ncbi:MAG: SIMPL domain-containing protein [Limnochordia bacterium]